MSLSYVLPLKWGPGDGVEELTNYLRYLSSRAEVIVVDGSAPDVFEAHHAQWARFCTHVPPDPDLRYLSGKVNGVHTGLRRATHEHVVIADDDVRYDDDALARIRVLLSAYDLVRPQNYFHPLPWHARWDTARSLLNRALSRDWPGTLGVRRSQFARTNGYDGDLLFENLELVRTVRASGGRVASPLDLYVRRIPPPTRRFWSQRIRQAYDEFARPAVLGLWLTTGPLIAALAAVGSWASIGFLAALAVSLAEVGRRRGNGVRVFPVSACLFAPVWILERAVCSWMAVASRLMRGGVPYAGTVIRRAANSQRTLERRFGGGAGLPRFGS